MNVIERLEFELAYYDSAVQHFNHYTTRIPPRWQISIIVFVSVEETPVLWIHFNFQHQVKKNSFYTYSMCFKRGTISTLSGKTLNLGNQFTYLGSLILSTENDVKIRLAKVWTASGRLSIIRKFHHLSKKIIWIPANRWLCQYYCMDVPPRL